MKKTIAIIIMFLIAGFAGHVGNHTTEISEFMNKTVYVNGHGVTDTLQMWQSLLALVTPIVLMGGATLIGYVKYRNTETKKATQLG